MDPDLCAFAAKCFFFFFSSRPRYSKLIETAKSEFYLLNRLPFLTKKTLPLTLYSIDTYFNTSTTDNFLKTLWEKKKLLVTSNFFFSHNVFYSIRKLYPPFVNIFDIISLFDAELEQPKIGM